MGSFDCNGFMGYCFINGIPYSRSNMEIELIPKWIIVVVAVSLEVALLINFYPWSH